MQTTHYVNQQVMDLIKSRLNKVRSLFSLLQAFAGFMQGEQNT